jgi:hypothetical protein
MGNVDPLPSKAIAATRRVILLSLVVIVYRLKEAREQLIAEWLLSETELENLGFPPIDQFIGRPKKWSCFETVRGQLAGHSFAKESAMTRPGRIISPSALGKALRETDLFEPEAFLQRVRDELVPVLKEFVMKLTRRYPEARQFVEGYASELEQVAIQL